MFSQQFININFMDDINGLHFQQEGTQSPRLISSYREFQPTRVTCNAHLFTLSAYCYHS